MLFHTWAFVLAFAVFFLLYHSLRRQGQNRLLLIGSYAFMALFDWRFLLVMLAYALVNFLGARWLGRQVGHARKAVMAALVSLNLAGLAFFKYCDFFLQSATDLLGLLGLAAHPAALGLILPVGISFYTFMAVGYLVDVYRGGVAAERNPLRLALFLSCFPYVTAGPIERAANLLPQLARERTMDGQRLLSGAFLFLLGLARKVGIADPLAALVDPVFADPTAMATGQLWQAMFLYSLLLYCDFAGYSDMARGLGRLLGLEILRNFEQPYLAASIAEFWRRWHTSLSSWLRDYLYIPLGGGRGSAWRVYRNLVLTMLLCGLWHGAAWHFVAWGGLHGLALILHRAWRRAIAPRLPSPPALLKPLAWLAAWSLTMLTVGLGWVLFRAPDMSTAWAFIQGLFILRGAGDPALLQAPALAAALVLFLDLPQRISGRHGVMLSWPRPWPALVVLGLLLWLLLAPAAPEQRAFIYLAF